MGGVARGKYRFGRVSAKSRGQIAGVVTRRIEWSLTQRAATLRIGNVLPESGPVAQLGARFHGMEEVTGSIPVRSTKTSLRKTQRNAKVSTEAGFFAVCCGETGIHIDR